ncbi:MAG: cysteine protease StiP family protein [Candidatus Adiutrix sp.]|jgi:hypothetical protein|nr:cysteine protease StiP family protein [Candidatus Adiutrix sp.]
MSQTFSGSYEPDDVAFLLKTIDMEPIPMDERERLIQSGRAHYSEMIGPESAPSARYLDLFHEGLARNRAAMARHLVALAGIISRSRAGPLTLVSLARAGVPVGVLLGRILKRHFRREVRHYSISVIRDRGIDGNALSHLLKNEGRPEKSIVFVDGWTGKGVMAGELDAAVRKYNLSFGTDISPDLYVLSDLCGAAAAAASSEDFLIPSCLLNSTVSGLISRTILNAAHIGPDDFHGCVFYGELAQADLSRWFVEQIMIEVERLAALSPAGALAAAALGPARRAALRQRNKAFIERLKARHGLTDQNHIKPGIGEATRVLLRRAPELLILRDPDDPQVAHLRLLARQRSVPAIHDANLPYRAAALIKALADA